MSAELVEALYSDLDLAVFSVEDNEHFICLNDPPSWFKNFAPGARKGISINLIEFSEFLKNFMIDAKEHWRKEKKGPLKSGLWIEKSSLATELPLEASAIQVKNQHILLLALKNNDFTYRQIHQQIIRDNLLSQENLEREVQRRTQQIREREEEMSIRLIAAAGYRDQETGAHIRKIGLYAAEIATKLGWTQEQINEIKLAAPMHDMGKISIADDIQLKPGRLDTSEYEIMKGHAQIGGEMLAGSGISMLDTASQIATCHHERWDGSGYPNGLKGEEIPEAARIVAIVDVYDALTNERVYKRAYSEEESLNIMNDLAGNHLDPKLYRLFLSIIDKIQAIKSND